MLRPRRIPPLALLLGTLVTASPALIATTASTPAAASVSVAVSIDDLITHAERVVVAQATHSESKWEVVNGSKRIVTYTQFDVNENILGSGKTKVSVRTLGGVVGKIGQQVSGEPQFRLGAKNVMFIRSIGATNLVVARAQGHYPLKHVKGEKELRLGLSPSSGKIVRRKGPRVSAQDALRAKTVSSARTLIREAKAAHDEREKD